MVEQPVGTAARYTAAAEELAASGRWEEAYAHLRAAVRLLHGTPSDDVERLRREHAEARGPPPREPPRAPAAPPPRPPPRELKPPLPRRAARRAAGRTVDGGSVRGAG